MVRVWCVERTRTVARKVELMPFTVDKQFGYVAFVSGKVDKANF